MAMEDSHTEISYCWLEEEEDGRKEPGIWMTSGIWVKDMYSTAQPPERNESLLESLF